MMWIAVFVVGMCVGTILALPLMLMEGTETFKAIDKKIANKIKAM